jgi:hypothetical protein
VPPPTPVWNGQTNSQGQPPAPSQQQPGHNLQPDFH